MKRYVMNRAGKLRERRVIFNNRGIIEIDDMIR